MRLNFFFKTFKINVNSKNAKPLHIRKPGIFRTFACSEPWYIKNPDIFRTLAYSELWYIQNQSHIQNSGIFRTSSIFTTLSSICGRAFYKNNKILFYTIFKYSKLSPQQDRSQEGRISVEHCGIFRYNQAYSGIIQGYSGTFRSLCNPGIVSTPAHSEPWYIQNPDIFRTLVYSKPWYIQDLKHIHNPVKHLRQSIL